MRLSTAHAEVIRKLVREVAGPEARVRLFGSRLDDSARGGDVDLLLELPDAAQEPALLAATLSARISRALGGRRVDVVVSAPNLAHSSIHELARTQGELL